MDVEVIKCGECAGCELERMRDALIKRLDDDLFRPRLEALANRITPTGCRADREHPEYRDLMRERKALLEHRAKIIDGIAREYRAAGCTKFLIRVPNPLGGR